MSPVQNITVDDRVSRAQFQYTLEGPDVPSVTVSFNLTPNVSLSDASARIAQMQKQLGAQVFDRLRLRIRGEKLDLFHQGAKSV
jgi:hypothetical protein